MASTLKELECKKCGHTWWPRSAKRPAKCPRCFNPNWHLPPVTDRGGRPRKPKEGDAPA